MTEEEAFEILQDPEKFFGLLTIVDKQAQLVPLELTAEQLQLLELYRNRGDAKLLILKPRQIGSSTFWVALMFYLWYTATTPLKILSMAHTHEAAKNFMGMFQGFWENLPDEWRARRLSSQNQSVMTLEDSGATYKIRTAGGSGGNRSFSYNVLHLSEFAFYPDAEELMATALPALNDGLLIVESTPNHWNDALHKRILQYNNGVGRWSYQFFPWSAHKAYSLDEDLETVTQAELELSAQHQLSTYQLAWRRLKIEELGYSKFKRDFPLTLEDAYTQGASSWLTQHELDPVNVLNQVSDTLVFEEPSNGSHYALGADVSGGVGADYSVVYVVNAVTKKLAYVFASNTCAPNEFAEKINYIGLKYNKAKVLVESNNHGGTVLQELENLHYPNLWLDKQAPWLTTTKTRILLFNHLRKLLVQKQIPDMDISTYSQLKSLKIEGDSVVLPKNKDGHSDRVVAMALAYMCTDSVVVRTPAPRPAFPSHPKNPFNRH